MLRLRMKYGKKASERNSSFKKFFILLCKSFIELYLQTKDGEKIFKLEIKNIGILSSLF